MDKIIIKGARENNLKNINLELPRDKFIVLTGVSGSGKTSLAFDTIYAEGQRRYVESLSAYARQFLGQMEKPDIDSIDGLSPSISIDQKTASHNPRSTVGTVTEIYDYLRLLYARIGIMHCPNCGKEIKRQTTDQIVDSILNFGENTRLTILSPVVRARKGEHIKLLEDAKRSGFVRVRIDGNIYLLEEEIKLDKNKKHTIEIIIDRIIIKDGIQKRLTESVETAMRLSEGLANILFENNEEKLYSQSFSCVDCDISIEELEPRSFSFNNPKGACPECMGLGMKMVFDEELIVPDKSLSLRNGAITAIGFNFDKDSFFGRYLEQISPELNFSVDTPFEDLNGDIKNLILYGEGAKRIPLQLNSGSVIQFKFEGVINTLNRRYKETTSDYMKVGYEALMANIECNSCHGKRLKKEVLSVTVGGKNIADLTSMNLTNVISFFENLELTDNEKYISSQILKEINARLTFLINVGLNYLNLSRKASTLSGGEAQRIRLATQIGSGLVGVIYILDEPSIGLHQKDNNKLLETLKNLRDLGNTLIVVEHDEDTMLSCDYIVDIGPYAGIHGGEVIYAGDVEGILKCTSSVTGNYLSKRLKIEVPEERTTVSKKFLEVISAAENNLKNINAKIPLGLLVCVTGVSGSGKSTLVNEIIYKSLATKLNRAHLKAGKHEQIKGIEHLDKIIDINQSPIGRTPRSNPATYTGVFDLIRDVFASTNEAKIRGYNKGRFSFNVKGGRCEACSGDGIIKIEMHFLPDIYVTCEACEGKRYNRETLEVKYKGKTISDCLNMTIEENAKHFENHPKISEKLNTLCEVGLSYLRLGQPSTTLSGGEAQRVKLATELSKRNTGKTLYILDEPTTGLHMYDVHKLINILQKLKQSGSTCLVIEHNLDVIKTADYIIDLGPDGGDKGGEIIACGTPEEVAKNKNSYTGQYLKKVLK